MSMINLQVTKEEAEANIKCHELYIRKDKYDLAVYKNRCEELEIHIAACEGIVNLYKRCLAQIDENEQEN